MRILSLIFFCHFCHPQLNYLQLLSTCLALFNSWLLSYNRQYAGIMAQPDRMTELALTLHLQVLRRPKVRTSHIHLKLQPGLSWPHVLLQTNPRPLQEPVVFALQKNAGTSVDRGKGGLNTHPPTSIASIASTWSDFNQPFWDSAPGRNRAIAGMARYGVSFSGRLA